MSEKITYVNGYCKAITTQYGEIINFEVNPKDLDLLPKNEKWFVRLSMMKRKEPWKYWETHYMKLNTYSKQKDSPVETTNVDDDLPFV